MHPERNYLVHPKTIIVYLLLAGITSLFIGFSIAYMYTRIQANLSPIELPILFYVNALILLGSSWALQKAKQAYLDDETSIYQNLLILTFGLSLFFLIMQIAAWYQLIQMHVTLTSGNMASYMYIISGVHFAHVIGGLPFLAYFIYQSKKQMVEPVSVLIYFADPDKKRNLKLLTTYWHFLDILWIYLILLFLLNYLIQ